MSVEKMAAPREGGEGNATDSDVMANIYVAMYNNPRIMFP